jgi:OmpA-OmpF porin, OOP family
LSEHGVRARIAFETHPTKPKEKSMRQSIVFAAAFGVAVGLGVAAALADEGSGYYVSAGGGVSLLPDLHLNTSAGTARESFGTGYSAGGTVGYDYGNGWRFELTSLYQHSDLSRIDGALASGHLESTSVMANATYDLLPNQIVTPYVGAGIGVQGISARADAFAGHGWSPAYQAEAGLRTDITDQASLFGEYRFSQAESIGLSDGADVAHQHFSDHALLAGLSFKVN